jgi:Mn-containing catalase
MLHHSKDLQFNARVSRPDLAFANILLEQFGGENGELAAAMQYFTQAFGAKQPHPEKQSGDSVVRILYTLQRGPDSRSAQQPGLRVKGETRI